MGVFDRARIVNTRNPMIEVVQTSTFRSDVSKARLTRDQVEVLISYLKLVPDPENDSPGPIFTIPWDPTFRKNVAKDQVVYIYDKSQAKISLVAYLRGNRGVINRNIWSYLEKYCQIKGAETILEPLGVDSETAKRIIEAISEIIG